MDIIENIEEAYKIEKNYRFYWEIRSINMALYSKFKFLFWKRKNE